MTRRISHMSILLALGLVLNLSVQVFSIQGMKIDFVVVMLCISLLSAESFNEAIIAGIAYGVLTALTTTFPYGQVANLVDKIIVACILYTLKKSLKINPNHKLSLVGFGLLGTFISGSIFLFIALSLSKTLNLYLPLLLTVVLPSMIGNSIMILLFHKTISLKKH